MPGIGTTDLSRKPLIVAVIPAYNEESNISKVLQQTRMYADKIIVCDDGSIDKTCEIAQASGATVVKHHRNLGYGAALSTLFKEARKLNPDVMVTLDADGQHNPAYIPKLIEPILNNSTDVVIGSRFLSEVRQRNIPAYRKVGIQLITLLAKIASYSGITDAQSGFRAYGKKAIRKIRPTQRGMGASTEILIKARQAKLAVKEIPMTISYRGKTSKQNPVVHFVKLALNTIKLVSFRTPQIFYGMSCIAVQIVVVLFWIRIGVIYAQTSELSNAVTSTAIGATIIGTILMGMGLILWRQATSGKGTKHEEE